MMPEIKNKLIQDMPSFIEEVYSDGCLMTKKKLDKSRNASVANVYVSSLVKTNKQKDTIAAESMIRPMIKSIFCCNSFPISFILQIKSISHIYSTITARHFETFATSYTYDDVQDQGQYENVHVHA